MTPIIGRPAVPDGSPLSLEREMLLSAFKQNA